MSVAAGLKLSGAQHGAHVAFTPSWDLRRIRPHLFPRSSAVVFGTRSVTATPMPTTALVWTGRAPHRHAHVETATQLRQHLGELSVGSEDDERSPYAVRFSQGANLVPRLMFRVEDAPTTGLGVPAGRIAVQSKRSAAEKQPWKGLPALTGVVESEFVWPTLLGEQIVPFHMRVPERFVVPLTRAGEILDGEHSKIDAYPGLAAWIRAAEDLWTTHGDSKMNLAEQIDHMRKLTQQLPVPPIRVAYAASGMHVSAALVTDPAALIEHAVYWAAVSTASEGHYLVGILNTPSLTELVRPLMSYGKDERHIDKAVWKLPIPTYDPDDPIHTEIAQLARELADEIRDMTFRSANFVTIRRDIRKHLTTSPSGQRLDSLVGALLGVESDPALPTIDLAFPTLTTTRLIRTTNTNPLPTPAVEIDVDCEFDSDGKVYLWGALLSTPTTEPTYYAFSSPVSDFDEHALADQFLAWITEQLTHDDTTAFWFHYGSTESRQLHRILGPSAHNVIARGIDILADIIRSDFYGPTGYSLKQLAPAAGAHWRTGGATGADTYAWIEAARAGDSTAWDTLTEYNEDDVRALRALRIALGQLDLPGSVLELESSTQVQG